MFPKWYDFFMKPLERGIFYAIRKNLLAKAHGSVLEIGSGTGINFPFYQSVDKVVALEPNSDMIERSYTRLEESFVPIEIIQERAEELPFENHSFDTVVATLVFCTIPNPDAAIKEIIRVCKPNGTILLFEHVRMAHPFLARLQVWFTPYWKRVCDGCCLDRKTVELVKKQGLEIEKIHAFYNGLFVQLVVKNRK